MRKDPSSPVDHSLQNGDLVRGIFQASMRRGGYLTPEAAGVPELRIPPTGMGEALHGDLVEVRVVRAKPGRQPRVQVVRVLRHANSRLIGQLVRSGPICLVYPRNKKIRRVVEIHSRLPQNEVPEGAWVEVEIRHWATGPAEPLVGRLVEVIGTEGEKGFPIHLLVRTAGVQPGFPAQVEEEAAALARGRIGAAEVKKRLDLRGARVFTVDPATAKDFDDAVSLAETLPDGWRVGVHIADVSHYVRPGTALDAEALERSTSVYPVDRVIPMLPEALSNGVCSLEPGKDKLTMTVLMDIDKTGQVSNVELHNSLIHSVRRFAYEEVQGLFDAADLEAGTLAALPSPARPTPVVPEALHADLMHVRAAARALEKARYGRGALDLDLPECAFTFDAQGAVTGLTRSERFEAHRMIEELMIAANEAVARTLRAAVRPTLYRVHGEPDAQGTDKIAPVLTRLGVPTPRGGLTREEFQAVLSLAHTRPGGTVVGRWVLRALMRAKYQPENIGHWGLASGCYLHFTSPIRRYPDLAVHRALKALLAGHEPDAQETAGLEALGRHTSQREERAQKIEWDAEEIVAMQFMRRYVGDIFEGFVSGVSPMGFYVELKDYPVEGLVRISQLDDDYYDLDEDLACWRGRRSGRTWGLTDPAQVLIERVDVMAGQMDLILVRKKRPGATPRKQPKPYRPPRTQRRGKR